jgi:hypothetical protein
VGAEGKWQFKDRPNVNPTTHCLTWGGKVTPLKRVRQSIVGPTSCRPVDRHEPSIVAVGESVRVLPRGTP